VGESCIVILRSVNLHVFTPSLTLPLKGEGIAAPHSVQTVLVPTGYAHFAHWPRLRRSMRRVANGAVESSPRITA